MTLRKATWPACEESWEGQNKHFKAFHMHFMDQNSRNRVRRPCAMSDLLVKPLTERVGRLEKARDSMKPLANTFQFANNCETAPWRRQNALFPSLSACKKGEFRSERPGIEVNAA